MNDKLGVVSTKSGGVHTSINVCMGFSTLSVILDTYLGIIQCSILVIDDIKFCFHEQGHILAMALRMSWSNLMTFATESFMKSFQRSKLRQVCWVLKLCACGVQVCHLQHERCGHSITQTV